MSKVRDSVEDLRTVVVEHISGNVGIGTSSPSGTLALDSTGDSQSIITTSGNGSSYANLEVGGYGGSPSIKREITFHTNAASGARSEKVRIDSSGNLLVATTDAAVGVGNTNTGHSIGAAGYAAHSRTSGVPLFVNRNTNDGNLITLNKSGVEVGNIGTKYGTVYMAGTAGGVLAGDAGLLPGTSSGTLTNGVYDLGGSPYKFKDLHLSGTVNGSVAAPTLFTYNHTGPLSPTQRVFTTRSELATAGLVTGGIYVFSAYLSAWNTGITSYYLSGVTKPWAFTTTISNNDSMYAIGDFIWQGHAYLPTVTVYYRMTFVGSGGDQEFLVSSASTSSSDFAVGDGNGRELTIFVKRIA